MSKRIRFMAELMNGWHLRIRRRLSLKSGRLGGVRYDTGINLAKGGTSLSGSVGPLTVNIGLRGITVTWRLGQGATITRQISFRRLLRPSSADTPSSPQLRQKRKTNFRRRKRGKT